MKNAFYFTLKSLFVLEIFKFCPNFYGCVAKWRHKKAIINFENKTDWKPNSYNTHAPQYLKN